MRRSTSLRRRLAQAVVGAAVAVGAMTVAAPAAHASPCQITGAQYKSSPNGEFACARVTLIWRDHFWYTIKVEVQDLVDKRAGDTGKAVVEHWVGPWHAVRASDQNSANWSFDTQWYQFDTRIHGEPQLNGNWLLVLHPEYYGHDHILYLQLKNGCDVSQDPSVCTPRRP